MVSMQLQKKDIPLYGLIDIEGNWVLEPKFRLIGAFGKLAMRMLSQ